MKLLQAILAFLILSPSMHAQFVWEHTGGPEGFVSGEIYYNKDYAFLYDKMQLYRSGDGLLWDAVYCKPFSKINISENIISIYFEKSEGIGKPKTIEFLISNDNGNSWHPTTVPAEAYQGGNQIWICSHGIYFKTAEKLYRSQTEGQSWKQISYDGIVFTSIFQAADKIRGKRADKIYEFNSQSGKWEFSWNTPHSDGIESIFEKDSIIILKIGNRLYTSQNTGNTWNTYPTSASIKGSFFEKGDKVYFLSGSSLRYSSDWGNNWTTIPLDRSYLSSGLINGKFFLTSSYGCYLFDEVSGEYELAGEGINSASIWQMRANQNQVWVGSDVGFFHHKYDVNDGIWSTPELPELWSLDFPIKYSDSGYLAFFDTHRPANALISLDNGTSWNVPQIPYGKTDDLENLFWIGDYIYVEYDTSCYLSPDMGNSWTPSSKKLTCAVIYKDQIWASDDSGKLFTSTDLGITWSETNTPFVNITSIHTIEDHIFVVEKSGADDLFLSTDGINWKFSGDGLFLNTIPRGLSKRKFIKFNDVYLLERDLGYFYFSVDNCLSWQQLNLNIQNADYTVLHDSIYLSLINNAGGGVIKAKLPHFEKQAVSGTIFNDLNSNGEKDPNEPTMQDVQLLISTAKSPYKNYFTLSDQDGQFEILPSYQQYDTLRPNFLSPYIESIEPPFYITHDSIENYDFAVQFRPDVTDAAVSGKFNLQPRPGTALNIHIQYQNAGTTSMTGSVSLKLDPAYSYIQSSPAPSEIIGTDSLVWNFEELHIMGINQILIEGTLSSNLQAGNLISHAISISPNGDDLNLSNNHFMIQDTVISSHISNIKRVFPAEGLTVEEMQSGKELEYTILFQNPHNHVVNHVQISDELPSNLDYTSIRVTGSSHEITKWELLPSGVLRVYFDSLNLAPVNNNDPKSQGFFSFAIRIRKDNFHNFSFQNKARIIFDRSHLIHTNSVTTKMLDPVISSIENMIPKSAGKLNIIPNPAKQKCTIQTNNLLSGPGEIVLFTLAGQLIQKQAVSDLSQDTNINLENLSPGVYFIVAEGKEGNMRGKLVLQE